MGLLTKLGVDVLSRPTGDTSKLPKLTGKDTGALARDLKAGREVKPR